MTEQLPILIFGATGLFGELLLRRLVRQNEFKVIGVARGKATLEALRESTGANILVLNKDDNKTLKQALLEIQPFAVVDCAGPFQFYGDDPYRFARAVIEAGAHYLDIADAADFVSKLHQLNALALANNVAAISGASTTPAISAAVADRLCADLSQVISIETTVVPGNRTRRTYSVMKAILGQVGQAFSIRRQGQNETVYGWSETQTIQLRTGAKAGNPPVATGRRLASLIHTPDIELFPKRYSAETVTFRAGLEIRAFHRALQFGSFLVRLKILKSLAPLTSIARWLASWFVVAGSDTGGMRVHVTGRSQTSRLINREWDLVVADGNGPEIPTLPVSILLRKLKEGKLAKGARAAPGDMSLEELEPYLSSIGATCSISEEHYQPLFEQVLGRQFKALPGPVKTLHSSHGIRRYQGVAEAKGSSGLTGKLIAAAVGFPAGGRDVKVSVEITANSNSESWVREFAGKQFHSVLSTDEQGMLWERFGFISLRLSLQFDGEKLYYTVDGGKLFGFLHLPRFVLPQSITHEELDAQGRFVFDVHLKTPFKSRIVHYRGWLEPHDDYSGRRSL